MKKPLKAILRTLTAAALLFCTAPHIHAEETFHSPDAPEIVDGETIDDGTILYTKSRTKGCVYVTSCQARLSDVTIPNEINGYKVLGIYDGAFAGLSSLTTVKISEGIEYIGAAAFYECIKLTSVALPKSISKISDNTFCYCTSLRKIEIPESVNTLGAYSFAFSGLGSFDIGDNLESIGSLAFAGCKSLKEINVSEKNPSYRSVDGILYSKDMSALEIFPAGKGFISFDIPESVSYIQPGAFHDTPLENINMTDNVKWIGATAFSACKSLKSVVLSNSITSLESGVFSDCISLKSIDLPGSLTSIGEYAFFGCNNLKNITVPESVNTIGEKALGISDDTSGKEFKVSGFKIKASYDSAAGKYARENGVSVEYTDGDPYKPFIIAGITAGIVIIAVVMIIVKNKRPVSDKETDNDNSDKETPDTEDADKNSDDDENDTEA